MTVQQQERAMREVLDGVKRQDGETRIRFMYRKCQTLKAEWQRIHDDDDFAVWTDATDKIEETIARFHSEDCGDIDTKLAVLIDRIRHTMEDNKAGAFDLILAMSAREDLRRIVETGRAPGTVLLETKADDKQPLDPAAHERLKTLLNETLEINIALGPLLESEREYQDDCHTAFEELHGAMGGRLVRSLNLVGSGNEED